MSVLVTLRRHGRPWARLVLAAFMGMWLNLAAQPCVMAAGIEDTAILAPATGEHEHSAAPAAEHDVHSICAHCAMRGGEHCASAHECDEPDMLPSLSSIKLFDGADAVLVPDPPGSSLRTRDAALVVPRLDVGFAGATVPLTIQYCVYLK